MMRLTQTMLLLFLSLFLSACQPTQSATPINRVDAKDYSAFWIWGDISSAPYLSKAQELYILQGEITVDATNKKSILIPQGISVLIQPKKKIWLVFRTHHLNWTTENVQLILKRIAHWENAGNHIQGLQIDFDSKTKNLKDYALFLQKIRTQLPQKYQLSITGLLDWTNVKDTQTLDILAKNIDELVIQSYQGNHTVSNYLDYLKRVTALKLPYKVGLVQHGLISKHHFFETDVNFKGYVIFLLRSKARS